MLYVLPIASAENCCVSPCGRVAADGLMSIDTSEAGVTVSVAVLEPTPFSDAVIAVDPVATVVARPLPLIVAFSCRSTARRRTS